MSLSIEILIVFFSNFQRSLPKNIQSCAMSLFCKDKWKQFSLSLQKCNKHEIAKFCVTFWRLKKSPKSARNLINSEKQQTQKLNSSLKKLYSNMNTQVTFVAQSYIWSTAYSYEIYILEMINDLLIIEEFGNILEITPAIVCIGWRYH